MMNTQQAKNIQIKSVLDKLGYEPAKEKGSTLFYFSVFHEEKTPSFKVDTSKNLWFDFSVSQGGSVIDLVMNLYKIEITEALKMLDDFSFAPIVEQKANIKNHQPQEVKKIQRLQNVALLQYLESRKIEIDIAKDYLQEVYFMQNGKNYFALCWKNDRGGIECRNKYFKGILEGGEKDITTIKGSNENLFVFEGMFDFLSFLSLQEKCIKNNNYMILNSLVLLDKLKEQINDYKQIFLYLDQDRAGKEGTAELLECNKNIHDKSGFYKGFKDLNDYLIHSK